jgi:hypothetical protein
MLRQRKPRQTDPGYLKWLREQRCACGCFQPPPCDAAHLRAASHKHAKPMTGMGTKPDDCWALPLKHAHHMNQHQHGNELDWWLIRRVEDPFELCKQYYYRYQKLKQEGLL